MCEPGPIHVFRPVFRVEETLAELRDALERGWTGLGDRTLRFEEAWREYTGLPHAHFVASATAGLHTALHVLREADGWHDGDEVITTPFTFVSTAHAIVHEGLRPVFADVDEYLCLDPASVEARIGPRTRAVIFVGVGGSTGRLPEVVELCRRHRLRLILDAAHMAGTRLHGRHVGHESDAAVFSFHAVKNLPTADSGMVCFRDPAHDRAARRFTWLGIDRDTYSRMHSDGSYRWRYTVEEIGYKYHGNSIMAAIGLVALRHLDEDNARRREIAARYDALLAADPRIGRVPVPPGCTPSRHLYQVLVGHRDEVMVELNRRQIFPGVHYRLVTDFPVYRDLAAPCPAAERAAARVISLPMHLALGDHDVERVAGALAEIVARHGREPRP